MATLDSTVQRTVLSVFAGKVTENIAVSMKTLPGLPFFAAMREKVRRMKPSYAARVTGLVSGEAKFVVQPILAVSVAFVDVLNALLSN